MATKTHNWVTGPNNKFVDPKDNRRARAFIDGVNHFTPAREAQLDEIHSEGRKADEERRRKAELEDITVCQPDPEVIEAYEDTGVEPEWKPDPEAFVYDKTQSQSHPLIVGS